MKFLDNFFNKKIILVQGENGAVSIYSSYKNLQEDIILSPFVNTDMTLVSGKKHATLVLKYNEFNTFTDDVYSVELKGDNSHLNDTCLLALNYYCSTRKNLLQMNVLGAYVMPYSYYSVRT